MEYLDGMTLKHRIGGRPWRSSLCSLSPSKLPTPWTPPTPKESFTATSSQPTYLSPNVATPRFSILAWRNLPISPTVTLAWQPQEVENC